MTILVTGSYGTVGSQVVFQLTKRGARVHALTRKPGYPRQADGATVVQGDMTDVDSMRSALSKITTLFLVNAVSVDEVTQALITLNLPIGSAGVSMVDTNDLAEVAALHLLRREESETPLPNETWDVVGPEALTGARVAHIWASTFGRTIGYAGDDVGAFEQQMKTLAPSWMAYDMRLMFSRIQEIGMASDSTAVDRSQTLLGRPLSSYQDFATTLAKQWARPGTERKSA